MKEIFSFRRSGFLSIRLLGIVLIICDSTFGMYGQSGTPRVDINRVYESEIERWLLPDHSPGSQTSLLAAFLVHPELDPDYSVCLVDSARQFFLLLRVLDKNLWHDLITKVIQKQSLIMSFKTSVYSTSVSKRFKKKIHVAYEKLSPDKGSLANYDGISYEVFTVKKGEMKNIHISNELKAEGYESEFIKLLFLISNDLRNNLFKESNYMDKLK